MKHTVVALILLAGSSGCMEHQLTGKTMALNVTTTDLLYMEVLDNVARTIDNPAEMPFFNMPATGTAQIQQQLSATVTPGWSLVTATASVLGYVGAFPLSSFSAAVNPLQIGQESWQLSPVADPDRLSLMHAAYLKATGHDSPENEAMLHEYFTNRDQWVEIGIQQTEFSNAVWAVSHEFLGRSLAVLHSIPVPVLLTRTTDPHPTVAVEQQLLWERFHDSEDRSFFPGKAPKKDADGNDLPDSGKELNDKQWTFIAGKLTDLRTYYSYMIILRQKDDMEFQRLSAKYALLSPPPAGQKPPGYSSGAGAAGGGGGGAGGAGGKPPLPIHVPYGSFIQPGWYSTGTKHDVPKDACFVGHHCKTYVWVRPDQMDGLNKFTLAILDFNNIQNSGGSNMPSPPPATLGR